MMHNCPGLSILTDSADTRRSIHTDHSAINNLYTSLVGGCLENVLSI